MHQGPSSTSERLTRGHAGEGSDGVQVQRRELVKRPLSFIRGFKLCHRGAGKPLKHSEQRISEWICISERSCSISLRT